MLTEHSDIINASANGSLAISLHSLNNFCYISLGPGDLIFLSLSISSFTISLVNVIAVNFSVSSVLKIWLLFCINCMLLLSEDRKYSLLYQLY